MPRAFAITAPTNSINLNDQGRGEVAFTVSNTSGDRLRGRAVVRALGSTQSDWLHIIDESERDFDSQTVHQFAVEVVVPQGAPEGTYSFRLDVVSVEDPDDVFDEGPVIAFEVREAEVPAPKPFPWWIVAAVAGFVIVVSIAIWIIIRSRPKEETPPTTIQYTIEVSSSAGGTIEPSGTVNVDHGTDQKFTINPDEGYHVKDVIVVYDGKSEKVVVDENSECTVTNVTSARKIEATFEINTYTITASASRGGTIEPGTVNVEHGKEKEFTITPSTGYKVADVLVDDTSVLVDNMSMGQEFKHPFTNVTNDHTIRARFSATYDIRVKANEYRIRFYVKYVTFRPMSEETEEYSSGERHITCDVHYSVGSMDVWIEAIEPPKIAGPPRPPKWRLIHQDTVTPGNHCYQVTGNIYNPGCEKVNCP